MRAVTEKHGKNSSGHVYSLNGTNKVVPPIKVVIADSKNNEDIAIKVCFYSLMFVVPPFYITFYLLFVHRFLMKEVALSVHTTLKYPIPLPLFIY